MAPRTTVSEAAADPADEVVHMAPQDPVGLVKKAGEEAKAAKGVGDKARKVLHELDRDIGGEYERRSDPTAAPLPPASEGD